MKRLVSLILSLTFILAFAPSAFAASEEAINSANSLYELGLFNGTGTDANGNPIFDLDRAPTRHEAVTMLVRLLGKEDEAKNGTWNTPFTDVAEWAKPYVGYAYTNGLTNGISTTAYGGDHSVTATQYLTFVLRALGYSSGTDFQWDKAWELSDKIGLTNGQYNTSTSDFTRGDVAIISYNALSAKLKHTEQTLLDSINQDTSITKEKLQGIWQSTIREYVFSGTEFTCALHSGGDYLTYQTGTYKVEENKVILSYQEKKYLPITNEISSKSGTSTLLITELSGTEIRFGSSEILKKVENATMTNEIIRALAEKENSLATTLMTIEDANQIIANLKRIGELANSASNSLLEARTCIIKAAGTTGRAQELMFLAAKTAFAEVLLDESETVKLIDDSISLCNKYSHENIILLAQKYETTKKLCQDKVDILTTICNLDFTTSEGRTTVTNLLSQLTSITTQETAVVDDIIDIISTTPVDEKAS